MKHKNAFLKFIRTTTAVVLVCAASLPMDAAAHAASNSYSTDIDRFMTLVAESPTNFVAQNNLAMKLFGTVTEVQLEGETEFISAEEAQKRFAETLEKSNSSGPQNGSKITLQNLKSGDTMPIDTFNVAFTKTSTPYGTAVGGGWAFASWFAGQTKPYDLANLQFQMGSCVKQTHHSSVTYDVWGNKTNLGSLRDANIGLRAPIWNIADYTTNFVPQAASGGVSVFLDTSACPAPQQVGASFTYQAIEGGSIMSVSVGWGFLNVGLSSRSATLKKSTAPSYFIV